MSLISLSLGRTRLSKTPARERLTVRGSNLRQNLTVVIRDSVTGLWTLVAPVRVSRDGTTIDIEAQHGGVPSTGLRHLGISGDVDATIVVIVTNPGSQPVLVQSRITFATTDLTTPP